MKMCTCGPLEGCTESCARSPADANLMDVPLNRPSRWDLFAAAAISGAAATPGRPNDIAIHAGRIADAMLRIKQSAVERVICNQLRQAAELLDSYEGPEITARVRAILDAVEAQL